MKLYILGCGALGSNIAMNLVFDRRDDEFILVDFDKVEVRNYQFGTQQYLREQQGQKKVIALQFNIYRFTGKKVEVEDKRIQDLDLLKADFVIDCLDNYEARNYVKNEFDKKKSLPCLHVGFSPLMTFEICWNENYQVPDDIKTDFDICEAEGARAFIHYVSGLATNVILEYLKSGSKIELIGNKFNVTKIE